MKTVTRSLKYILAEKIQQDFVVENVKDNGNLKIYEGKTTLDINTAEKETTLNYTIHGNA